MKLKIIGLFFCLFIIRIGISMENLDMTIKESYRETWEKSWNTPFEKVFVDNVNGDITIETGASKFSVEIEIIAYGKTQAEARENLKHIEIRVPDEGNKIFRLVTDPQKKRIRFIVNYHLYIPNNIPISIDAVNGDLNITSDFGPLSIDMVNANVDLNGQKVHGKVDLVNGNVSVTAREISNLSLDLVNGDVDVVTRQKALNLDLDSFSSSKTIENIDISESASGLLKISLVNGSVSIKGNR